MFTNFLFLFWLQRYKIIINYQLSILNYFCTFAIKDGESTHALKKKNDFLCFCSR